MIYRNPLAQMEEEKKNHDNKMKKMEQEMEQVFEMKVKERNQRLLDSEDDVRINNNRFVACYLAKIKLDSDYKKFHILLSLCIVKTSGRANEETIGKAST